MAQVINDTDKLTFILTNYGLERVAQALESSTVELNLSKIKVGNANYEYYIPTGQETELKNPIEGGSFYIINKELLEDNLTVSLHTVFPEDFENHEIREVGIYETIDGVDYLFAISTQQPLLKPLESLNYFISVDYYAFLKSQNLAEVYDQIIINPETALITEEDFNNLMSTILFSESNLMEQINGNSRVIGLNRARQLAKKINEIKSSFSYSSLCDNFTNLLDMIDPTNLFSYWIFNYANSNSVLNAIADIGPSQKNLSTNVPISTLERDYKGLMPLINYSSPNYFYLNQGISKFTFNSNLFRIQGAPTITDGVLTEMSNTDYVDIQNVSIQIPSDWSLIFNFTFTDLAEVITEESDKTQYLLSSSSSNILEASLYIDQTVSGDVVTSTETTLNVKIGGGSSWIGTLSTVVDPDTECTAKILYSNGVYSLQLLEEGEFVTKDTLTSVSTISLNLNTLSIGKSNNENISYIVSSIDLKKLVLTTGNNQVFSGGMYTYFDDMNFLNEPRTSDISFTMGFVVEPLSTGSTRTLLARSNYSNNSHIFEVNEKADNSLEINYISL